MKGLTWRSVIFPWKKDAQDVKKMIEECGGKAVLLPGDLSDGENHVRTASRSA
ncbi:hypothetical protein ACLB1N_29700 [Escherichia coli]